LLIILNGEERDAGTSTNIEQLIEDLNLRPERVAVELNGEVVKRVNWSNAVLSEGDRVEIIHFVGGGSGSTTFVSPHVSFLFPNRRV
jgi:thiamine biosynthesis protein ThiS